MKRLFSRASERAEEALLGAEQGHTYAYGGGGLAFLVLVIVVVVLLLR